MQLKRYINVATGYYRILMQIFPYMYIYTQAHKDKSLSRPNFWFIFSFFFQKFYSEHLKI